MSRRHALRLTPRRMACITRLHEAGPRGLALVDADEPLLLEHWGLAEQFTDSSRILFDRVRLTAFGTRCQQVLIEPKGPAP